jgi:hypothetical protein
VIIGKPVTFLGPVDDSCAVKVISNLIGMTNLKDWEKKTAMPLARSLNKEEFFPF